MSFDGLSPRALMASYISALLIIATLTIASHLYLEMMLADPVGSAQAIDESSGQRKGALRIVAFAVGHRLGDEAARAALLDAVSDFEITHARLSQQVRAPVNGGPGAARLHALYFVGAPSLDDEIGRFVGEARRLASLPAGDSDTARIFDQLAALAHGSLAGKLDAVAAFNVSEGGRKAAQFLTMRRYVVMIVLTTLLLEALLIFQPMVRRINRSANRLIQLATTDGLTGMLSRQAFVERSRIELDRARRHGRPLSVLMLDADHFKKINDTHGHAAGDTVLRALGTALQEMLRASDVAGRLGGEEFAVLLPETGLADAVRLAERIREAIAAITLPAGESEIRFTVSIGVAGVAQTPTGIEDALNEADALMYRAKRDGRNRVAHHLDAGIAA